MFMLNFQEHKWIISRSDGLCMEANATNEVILSPCRQNSRNQMWEFGNFNITAIRSMGHDW